MADIGGDSRPAKGGRSFLPRALAAVFLFLFVVSVAIAAGPPPPGQGRYIVMLKDSIERPGAIGKAQIERYGGHLGFVYRYAPIGYSATLSEEAVEAIERDPRVRKVAPDHEDVLFAQLPSTGIKRTFAFGNKALQFDEENNTLINADVAVVDAGFAAESDLNFLKRFYCNDAGEGAECTEGLGNDLANGHGTGVASVIGALDNKEGVVGTAPGVRLWSFKVGDPGILESEVVAALNYITEKAEDIEVANLSLGCVALPCTREAASAAISAAAGAGVVVVIAAGNQNADAKGSDYAKNPNAITVSGIADYDGLPFWEAEEAWSPSCMVEKQAGDTGKYGEDDSRYTESNYGEVVDVTAPAVCIRALAPGKALFLHRGTSFAAPAVSAAAAILAEQSNPETLSDVMEIRETIMNAGNYWWTDTSPDESFEPLLDLSNEEIFK